MRRASGTALVTTIQEHCRVCYTCVRECPAKAIRISEGQAQVLPARCIGCGNCVRVCSQRAKQVLDGTGDVRRMLESGRRVAAIVAPSFPSEFSECGHEAFVGMCRRLGFDIVSEVSFGADLVAYAYRQLVTECNGNRYIATNCPAIVAFVERYHPDLVENLAPIISPMAASARVVRQLHGDDINVVFIGPCIAKKGEIRSEHLQDEVDAALTFLELRELFEEAGVSAADAAPSDFDPPLGGPGGLFPISRGLLQAAEVSEDLMAGRVVTADGRTEFVDAIEEFETGHLEASLLEVLACNGCINGPGLSRNGSLFLRRNRVSRYVRERMAFFDWDAWDVAMEQFKELDLSRGYSADDQRIPAPSPAELERILRDLGKEHSEDELNCGACGYESCRDHAVAIYKGLAETEMCLPHVIDRLRTTMGHLEQSTVALAQTREALVQSEKLASMGQLAAGIAHELNNPLGVVLMYAHLMKEDAGGNEQLCEDLATISEQADRCKKIVAGLLHFARQNKVERSMTNLPGLLRRLERACAPPENVRLATQHSGESDSFPLDGDQMLQVLTNLANNAMAAMPGGGEVQVKSEIREDELLLEVADTGTGISREHRSKIFEPFFTTKEVGKGTGLGLAVTYGIVKMHNGDITIDSNDDPAAGPTGSCFRIRIPRAPAAPAALSDASGGELDKGIEP